MWAKPPFRLKVYLKIAFTVTINPVFISSSKIITDRPTISYSDLGTLGVILAVS